MRDRTADLLRARQALSQLSYNPNFLRELYANLVGLGRLELPTSPLSGVRSNQLSYRPVACRCFFTAIPVDQAMRVSTYRRVANRLRR